MSIQSVRQQSQKMLLTAADQAGLSDKQLAESIKAGWVAWDAKYCPGGKKSETCPFPGTKESANKAIDAALKESDPVIRRQKIVGMSNVDDGKFPLTADSKAKIDLFNAAVAKKIGAFKAINACEAKGTTFDPNINACKPIDASVGIDTNLLYLGAGALALYFLLGRKR